MDQELIQKIRNQVNRLCEKELLMWKLLRLEEITQNISEQFERINLQKQPEQLKKLQNARDYIEHYLDTSGYPLKEKVVKPHPQIQVILEKSSSLLTCSKKAARKQEDGAGRDEWIGITAKNLVTQKALARNPLPCYPPEPPPALKPSEMQAQEAILTRAQSTSPSSSVVEEEIESPMAEEASSGSETEESAESPAGEEASSGSEIEESRESPAGEEASSGSEIEESRESLAGRRLAVALRLRSRERALRGRRLAVALRLRRQ
ncbi:uncharacterized protein LOC103171839 isoform X1 [Callorhinchus milii]|uniref:uncharacterized protein LOC103171839 isoform X1 n=2 Tax=Callorhinchus milii TaxID=7868 RepID=UPI001C3FB7F4|nr:uncharacterized protein LOC103171839 isoform X1 [Callorhinchus milii]